MNHSAAKKPAPGKNGKTKGMLTAERIMDAAEPLFAAHGYEGTSLRQITRRAKITEPGLYNHFRSKKALYEAVLDRALSPMSEAMTRHLANPDQAQSYDELPSIMTDILLAHPQVAALFQQALQGNKDSIGNRLIKAWLDKLLLQGSENMMASGISGRPNRENMAINIIAMFNLTTGYFLAQRAFETLAEGSILDPQNIAKQKRLLKKIQRAMVNG